MFGTLVVAYLFLGGCGAGTLFVTSLLSLTLYAGRRRSVEVVERFARLRAWCYLVGTGILLFAVVCLACDLGRPERLVYLLVRPTLSYLAVGAYALVATLAMGAFLVATGRTFGLRASGRAKRAGEVVCTVLALVVMLYTGLYLQQLKAVAFWNTPLLPALFVLSSLSTGIVTVLLVWSLACPAEGLARPMRRLRAVHLVVVALEAVVLAAYGAWALDDPLIARSVALLTGPDLAPWLFGGVLGCGVVVPLLDEAASLAVPRPRGTPFAPVCNALVLVGGFSLRLCVVSAGLH